METNCSKCSAMLDPNPFRWCSSKSLVKEQHQSLPLAHMGSALPLGYMRVFIHKEKPNKHPMNTSWFLLCREMTENK